MPKSFFDKVASLQPVTLSKKRFQHWYFPVNFAKSFRAPFLQNASRRLLLNNESSRTTFRKVNNEYPNRGIMNNFSFLFVLVTKQGNHSCFIDPFLTKVSILYPSIFLILNENIGQKCDKKVVSKNLSKFTRVSAGVSVLNKAQAWNFFKKNLRQEYFYVNFAKFQKSVF